MSTVVFGDGFEWDDAKALANVAKHGVSFEEAAEALEDPRSSDVGDVAHAERVVTLAMCARTGVLYIVSCERGARVRIISARRATRHEQRSYEARE